jgi:hypothetical protein
MNLYLTLLIHQKYLWDSCSHELIQKPADAAQERRIRALDSWHRALENFSLRMDCPDAYNEELLRQADEMDRLGIVNWVEWRDLRREADQAYLRAVAGEDCH